MQEITCNDITELLKLLCTKGTYVSVAVDIHDGEVKNIETLWKTRGKKEIDEFIKRFRLTAKMVKQK